MNRIADHVLRPTSIRPTNNPAKWMIVDERTQRVIKFIDAPKST